VFITKEKNASLEIGFVRSDTYPYINTCIIDDYEYDYNSENNLNKLINFSIILLNNFDKDVTSDIFVRLNNEIENI
jgi:hypothetical protein